MRVTQTIDLPGMLPSRTRAIRDGKFAAYGVRRGRFISRIRTINPDARIMRECPSGDDVADLESFAVVRNDKEIHSVHSGFWGVTFTRGSQSHIRHTQDRRPDSPPRGRCRRAHVQVIAEGIECPRARLTKRTSRSRSGSVKGLDAWWQPAVVDLATMTVRQLPEPKHIDDQIQIGSMTGTFSTRSVIRRAPPYGAQTSWRLTDRWRESAVAVPG